MAYTEQDKKEMSIRQAKVDIGQGTGNALTNAVNIVIALNKNTKATKENFEQEIEYWLNWLYEKSRDKIEVEHKGWLMENIQENDTNRIEIEIPQ